MRGYPAITELPPAAPASWYETHRPCSLCVARVLNRIERADGGAALRVLHAEGCQTGSGTSMRGGGQAAAVQRDKPAQVADQLTAPSPRV